MAKEKIDDDDKMFFSIGEVAKKMGVATSLIRFWETEFDCLQPYKNKKGTRYFTKEDIFNLQTIYYLVKQKGYTLQGAKNYLQTNKEQVEKNAQIVQTLGEMKNFLIALKNQLE
ncbi:MAG: MerR family transcriptional regulator [Bacteroidales bacterium]|jgi:DNA-binding transcriptional MerR regulator|nr:MerR family transcriptional regulator [Bacteroidales bacterium]